MDLFAAWTVTRLDGEDQYDLTCELYRISPDDAEELLALDSTIIDEEDLEGVYCEDAMHATLSRACECAGVCLEDVEWSGELVYR